MRKRLLWNLTRECYMSETTNTDDLAIAWSFIRRWDDAYRVQSQQTGQTAVDLVNDRRLKATAFN